MPQTDQTLRVLPNPYHFLDHLGVPAATFPLDPDVAGGSRRWVGATVDPERTHRIAVKGDLTTAVKGPRGAIRKVFVDRAPMKRIAWRHEVSTPTSVVDTPHHRLGLREGSLFPGDAATATAAGLPFVEPTVALQRAAAAAVETWTRTRGTPPDVDAWPPNLRAFLHGAAVASPHAVAPGAVAAILATIPSLAAAAAAQALPSFVLASWDPGDAGAVALHDAVLAALRAAGLQKITETTERVGGAPTAHALVLDGADLAAATSAAQARAVVAAAASAPSWLAIPSATAAGAAGAAS